MSMGDQPWMSPFCQNAGSAVCIEHARGLPLLKHMTHSMVLPSLVESVASGQGVPCLINYFEQFDDSCLVFVAAMLPCSDWSLQGLVSAGNSDHGA